MGIVGKFVSKAWNGIKNGIGTAGKLIQSGANKAWNFVKDNQDTLGKVLGTAVGAGLNLYTGGAAAPFISGANNFIQGLPDNAFTKHLKNIFDYSTNTIQKDAERKPEQTNASTEYQAPRMSNFVAPSSAVASPSIVRPVTKSPQTKHYKNNNKNYNNKNYSKKSNGKRTGSKKTKGK